MSETLGNVCATHTANIDDEEGVPNASLVDNVLTILVEVLCCRREGALPWAHMYVGYVYTHVCCVLVCTHIHALMCGHVCV